MNELADSLIEELGLTLPLYWGRLSGESIKRVARYWLGRSGVKSGKQANLDALAQVFAQEAELAAIREGLTPFQRAALGLLARRGGVMSVEEFSGTLLALGHPCGHESGRYPFGEYGYHDVARFGALNALEDLGLVAGAYVPRPETDLDATYVDRRDLYLAVYSDPRLLRGIEPAPPVALPLQPVAVEGGGSARRPAEVSLRLLSLVEALRRQSPFKLTNRGRPPKPLITKLTKALGWDPALENDPHTPLPEAPQFFYRLLVGLHLIERNGEFGKVAAAAEELLHLPYPAQAWMWAMAYTSLTGWLEYEPHGAWYSQEDLFGVTRYNGLRAILATALGALPDPDGWYDFGQFEQALFDRVGERWSLSYLPPFYEQYGGTPAQKAARRADWQKRLRNGWAQSEAPYLRHALAGPLYHLGLVEVGRAGASEGLPDRFRLTPLGKLAFYHSLRPGCPSELPDPALPLAPESSEPSWIVQPNFEVIAYLDRVTPPAIGFLGKVAERKPSEGAVAVYRLTRETVYAALEGGLSLPVIVEELERGARQPLPATVRRTLEDWAARRERIALYLQADVLEYPEAQLRDAALARHPRLGLPVGERFILVAPKAPRDALRGATVIDYLQPPIRCLEVAEDRTIRLDAGSADFLIRGELAQWATPAEADSNEWRLDHESVGRAAQGGWSADQILSGLAARSRHALPELVQVAVRAWARKRSSRPHAALAPARVLQFAEVEAAEAVAQSALFQPLLGARLGPRTFLVEPEQEAALSERLAQFGLGPGTDLESLRER